MPTTIHDNSQLTTYMEEGKVDGIDVTDHDIRLAAGTYTFDSSKLNSALLDENSAVSFSSLDANAPATVTDVKLTGIKNVTFDGLNFNYTHAPNGKITTNAFDFRNVKDLLIKDSVFVGDTSNTAHGTSKHVTPHQYDGTGKGKAVFVENSDDVVIEGNQFSGWFTAVNLKNVSGTNSSRVSNNEFFDVSNDGIYFNHSGNISNPSDGFEISNNYFHGWNVPDDLTSNNNHPDYMQIIRAVDGGPVSNVVIKDNIFDDDYAGSTRQYSPKFIFLRNKYAEQNADDPNGKFKDVLIEGNLIRGINQNGIAFDHTEDIVIQNNTLLRNQNVNNTLIRDTDPFVPLIKVGGKNSNPIVQNNVLTERDSGQAYNKQAYIDAAVGNIMFDFPDGADTARPDYVDAFTNVTGNVDGIRVVQNGPADVAAGADLDALFNLRFFGGTNNTGDGNDNSNDNSGASVDLSIDFNLGNKEYSYKVDDGSSVVQSIPTWTISSLVLDDVGVAISADAGVNSAKVKLGAQGLSVNTNSGAYLDGNEVLKFVLSDTDQMGDASAIDLTLFDVQNSGQLLANFFNDGALVGTQQAAVDAATQVTFTNTLFDEVRFSIGGTNDLGVRISNATLTRVDPNGTAQPGPTPTPMKLDFIGGAKVFSYTLDGTTQTDELSSYSEPVIDLMVAAGIRFVPGPGPDQNASVDHDFFLSGNAGLGIRSGEANTQKRKYLDGSEEMAIVQTDDSQLGDLHSIDFVFESTLGTSGQLDLRFFEDGSLVASQSVAVAGGQTDIDAVDLVGDTTFDNVVVGVSSSDAGFGVSFAQIILNGDELTFA